MRPTPQELITGVIGILTDTVGPQVRDEYAANRLREVCSVLAQIDWNDAGVALHADNDAAARLLADWCHWVGANAARSAAFAAQRAAVEAVLHDHGDSPVPQEFEVLNTRHAALGVAVAEVASAVRGWAGDDESRRTAAEPVLTAMLRHYSTAKRSDAST